MNKPLIETPSGKGAGDENFPVGSFLLPAHLRPHVAVFYAFARAVDDIADNSAATREEKIARLNAMEEALLGKRQGPGLEKAVALHESLVELNVTTQHGQDLIDAFRQDAVQNRYDDWADLMHYCDRSAAPVGRYLLDIHGEDKAHYRYSDALCNALQVINHLQDCGEDKPNLDRIYLPQDWMREEGAVDADLDKSALTPALRRVVDRCLSETNKLVTEAFHLPRVLKSKRLAAESRTIVRIAERLVRHLKARDPLSERVELSKLEFLWCGLLGIFGRP